MTTEKKEPTIIPNGNSIEEIYQWMEKKLEARKLVVTLETQLKSLNSAQRTTQEQLNDASSASVINITEK
ncbi:hypothetical protein Q4R51_19250 [Morganella morganii]|uniref:hypothetical protein n=1 Tax=Morganella morganii TaxID=582 RepID=UPI001BDB2510|nr:hypothetical protein [Morganella morganii]MBT0358350.1 hypothetical protein [Morganella morganii subsp. morganii]